MAEPTSSKDRPTPQNAAEVAREEIHERVERDLGDEAAASFRKATAATAAGRAEAGGAEAGAAAAAALNNASEIFVSILKAADERGAVTGAGYAEVLLGYARCLMVYVQREGGHAQVFGEGVTEGMTAAGKALPPRKKIDVLAGEDATDVIGAEDVDVVKEEEADDDDDDDDDEKAEEGQEESVSPKLGAAEGGASDAPNEEEDEKKKMLSAVVQMVAKAATENPGTGGSDQEEGTDELCWDALEVARNIFARLGPAYDSRLSAVHELIGDYLSETDADGPRTAAEYALAAEAEKRAHGLASRSVANCRWMQFLAARREDPDMAVDAVAAAIESFRAVADAPGGTDDDRETASMLERELNDFKAALESHRQKKKGAAAGSTIGFAKTAAPPPSSGDVVALGSGAGAAKDDVVPVRAESRPIAVTVKPRRRAKPVAVQPTDAEIENGALDVKEPDAKKRKV